MKEYTKEPRKPCEAAQESLPEDMIEGRNAVTEALRSGRTINKVFLADGDTDRALGRLAAMAKESGAVVVRVDRRKLNDMSPTGAHQGIMAAVAAHDYATVDDMLNAAQEKGEAPLLVICDELSDPHNLGAIIRTAECAGAHGVVIPERRSAGLNPACVKAAAGAVEYMKVARVSNLCRAIEEIKERGVWVYAADMDGENVYEADLTGAVAIVIGAEGEGVSQLVLKNCDKTLSIPMKGHINSLNASVAAGIMLFQASRARNG